MGKEKIKMEYMLKAGSGSIIWNIIGTPSGLETWLQTRLLPMERLTLSDGERPSHAKPSSSDVASTTTSVFIGAMTKKERATSSYVSSTTN